MGTSTHLSRFLAVAVLAWLQLAVGLNASAQSTGSPNGRPPAAVPTAVAAPLDYVIGPDDILTISFWRDKDLSAEVVVRPDGKVSLQLINEVQAAGLTPEQLRVSVTQAASKFVEDPTVTVVVKQINSRKVFVVGQVNKPGTYMLGGPMTVVQMIAVAGGLTDFADRENIVIVRAERRPDGEPLSVRINYSDLMKRKNLKQNVDLKPGDTIMVP
ncbi:MAG: polysaccharide biosynthesis/export family protein [Vicinamibacterales bacterium]